MVRVRLFAVALALCGGATPVLAQTTPTTLHAFNVTDGANPYAGLTQASDGNFYGATHAGGTAGLGTIFRINSSGTFATLVNFTGANGSNPSARLVQGSDGNLYGTTIHGGASGFGTIFKISLAGTLTTLHTFVGSDGANPGAGLIQASDSAFYGTTTNGGAPDGGTIFKITAAGVFTMLHEFSGTEGSLPLGGLVQAADGSFYGTAYVGGANGAGTVFRMTSGTVTALHDFDFTEGAFPVAGLLKGLDGSFYGTTTEYGPGGGGTIFKVNSAGVFATLHGFDGTDGGYPEGDLTQSPDGSIYGTTYEGGVSFLGTIFKLDSAGVFSTLHSFAGTDGAHPYGQLLRSGIYAYGTTLDGGASSAGIVFRLQIASGPSLVPSAVTGVYGGTATLSATLTSDGASVAGKSISFALNATSVGSAMTNGAGVATLTGVSLAGISVGLYSAGVLADFAGDGTIPALNGIAALQINQAVPTITWGTPADIIAGTPLGPTQLNATASVGGSFVYTPSAGTVLPHGTHTLSVTFTPTDSTNYSSNTAQVSLNVLDRAPVLTNPGNQTNADGSVSYADVVLSDGPVGYWRLAEASGATAADTAGTSPGTLFGGVTLGQSGALSDGNPAMLFNGSTGHLRVNNSAAVQITGDLTIELWLNAGLTTRQTLVSKDYRREFELTLETNGQLNLYQGNGTTYQNVASTAAAVTANTWQHVVVTREMATQTIRFYVNGVAKGSGTFSVTPAAGTNQVSIGRSASGIQYVNGRLDEVTLYRLVLSAAQAAAHYGMRTAPAGGPTVVALQLVATDPDADVLSYSASGLPTPLTANTSTGLISGTLGPASAGTHQVTATASDGLLSNSQQFTWTVTHLNRPPVLTNPGNKSHAEAAVVSLQLVATDPDGGSLTYSATGLPSALTVNPTTGLISGTLSYTSAGAYAVTASVSDGSLATSKTFIWTVTNTDRPPVLTNPGPQRHSDKTGYASRVVFDAPVAYWRLAESAGTLAGDSAGTNVATVFGGVTFGQSGPLADGNPAMLLNGSTGYLRANSTPALQLAGDLTIELWLNVAAGTRQTLLSKDYRREFELTLESNGQLNLYQGDGTAYQGVLSAPAAVVGNTWQHVVVTREMATQTIRFYVNGVAKGSGTISVTPAAGTNPVVIGRSGVTTGIQYVNGRLDDIALYPTALSAAQITAHYGLQSAVETPTVVSLQLVASDPDGDTLSYSAILLPVGLTVNAPSGLISGTLSAASAGTRTVTATASAGGASNSQAFTWTVTHVKQPPVLTNPGNQTHAEGAVVSVPLTATDPDSGFVTYTATGLPAGLTLGLTTGVISGTVSYTAAGTYTVTATASDGSLPSSQTFTWTVTNTNRPPVVTNPGPQSSSDLANYPSLVQASTPAGYWRFDESSGTTAADAMGINPATLFGGVTLGQAGALADGNAAMLFNGSTGYARVNNSPSMQLAGDFTLELWMNITSFSRQTLLSKDYRREFELTLETNGQLNLYQGNGTTYQNVASVAGAVARNTWQHVVVTREMATQTVRFYVNGVAKGSGTISVTPAAGTDPVVIGRSGGGATGIQYVGGRLDEVALYAVPLSAGQVAAHYGMRNSTGAGAVVALQVVASDPDGDGLTYSATGLPAPLTIHPTTGLISGTLGLASAGTYQVTVTASDGTLTHSQTFTWTVSHTGS